VICDWGLIRLHCATARQAIDDWGQDAGVQGGTGFQPVVSGILPETWGAHYARGLTDIRSISARAKSGRMPDLTGWKPVPPSVPKNIL
jgi:hypothetical protein